MREREIMKDFFGKDASRLRDKKLYLFDMDGTIYRENDLFFGVKEMLAKIKGRTAFFEPDTFRSPQMGVPPLMTIFFILCSVFYYYIIRSTNYG